MLPGEKSIIITYVLWLFLGVLGVHRFYLHHNVSGVIYFFTGGICGLGWLVDICFMVDKYNSKLIPPTETVVHTTVYKNAPTIRNDVLSYSVDQPYHTQTSTAPPYNPEYTAQSSV